MSVVIKARGEFQKGFSVFLSGSVSGRDWRAALVERLNEHDIVFLDPRSDDYESIVGSDKFHEQVDWEQDGLTNADVIAMYFNHDSVSPISLMEFGLFARSEKMVVYCAKEYKHKGYVDAICDRHKIEQVDSLEELAEYILTRYSKHKKE